ncbi:putative complex I intermediate-associated protein 30 [Platanthera zijinensis]|uniref:Complex I intermediate-associated protein 30 n=1 Tax=Platanthera zijinensis TaxID=2320716 RepID=A0AAP0AYJ8_9ASPA
MSKFRSLWQASISATKRAFAWNFEDLIPPSEKIIFSFNSKDELKKWHLYSDSEFGGLSAASLEIKDGDTGLSGIFSGNLSSDVDEGSIWRMTSSGFCGMRSKKLDGFIDLDAYDTITMKLRSDGRPYISTIYTDNWVTSPGKQEDNTWQAFIISPKDEWHEVKIPLEKYLPTWRGSVIDVDLAMNQARILGMSISVNAGVGVGSKSEPGPFRLEIDSIKALRA